MYIFENKQDEIWKYVLSYRNLINITTFNGTKNFVMRKVCSVLKNILLFLQINCIIQNL